MSLASHALELPHPEPLIPLTSLRCRLPEAVWRTLLPYLVHALIAYDDTAFVQEMLRSGQDFLPPWDDWFERWHETYHPAVWELLIADDRQAEEYETELMMAKEDEEMNGGEGWVERRTRLEKLLDGIRTERMVRLEGLLILHVVRELYMQLERTRHPLRSDSLILAKLPKGRRDGLPTFPPASAWPFDLPFPSSALKATAHLPPPSRTISPSSHNLVPSFFRPKPDRFFMPDSVPLVEISQRDSPTLSRAADDSGFAEEEDDELDPPPYEPFLPLFRVPVF